MREVTHLNIDVVVGDGPLAGQIQDQLAVGKRITRKGRRGRQLGLSHPDQVGLVSAWMKQFVGDTDHSDRGSAGSMLAF
ncbi:MAG: hypothetical protein JWQ19_1096 [Subtercola sp.]|nr:hypothetical protein [Subtercola sp.]